MSKFEIDFFELMFLAESVMPEAPIARSMCFDSFSEVHYHKMTDAQREQFFKHVKGRHSFDMENKQCKHFYARFSKETQYKVETNYLNEINEYFVYLYNNEYHISENTFIAKEFITKIEKA